MKMAYIALRRNREGKQYVYLAEGWREGDKVRTRNLINYGKLEDLEAKEPEILDRLRKEAKEGKLTGTVEDTFTATFDFNEEIDYDNKNYGWKVLNDVYDLLEIKKELSRVQKATKIEFDIDKALRLLVFQRVIEPSSKLATTKSQMELFGDWSLTKDSIYRSLKYLETAKEFIQLRMHENITRKIGRVATLVFYDVTNYSFEIDFNDEDIVDKETGEIKKGKRQKGMCKKNGKNPIVQMGLFMDSNGIPISYKLFEGNKPDVSTYIDAIKQVKEQFGIERIVVVADKAMNSGNNIFLTSSNEDGWLFSQKHRGSRGVCKKLQAFIIEPSGWLFNEETTFAQKSMIRTRKIKTTSKPSQTKEVTEKVLVTWNKKYSDREKRRRDGALEYASKLTNAELFRQTAKKGGKRYLELFTIDKETGDKVPFNPLIEINQEAVKFDEQFDGVNVLVTSELEMSDEEMIKNYKELSRIEDNFKVTKTDFKTKPVYVRNDEHIEAHFLTCFIALTLMRIIQHMIGNQMSPGRIINALQSAKANELGKGIYRVQANDDMKLLNSLLGIEFKKKFVKVEELTRYSRGWCTTKIKTQ